MKFKYVRWVYMGLLLAMGFLLALLVVALVPAVQNVLIGDQFIYLDMGE